MSSGEKLDFFLVEHTEPNLLLLTERDSHLDVMIAIATQGPYVTITASVVTHNLFGRLYMLPADPAHHIIVPAMLRRLKRALSAHNTA